MTPTSTSKPRRVSYNGFPCTVYELHFTGKSIGKRVVIDMYDNGSVTIRAIKGDGRSVNFREFESIGTSDISFDVACAKARDMADRHFA